MNIIIAPRSVANGNQAGAYNGFKDIETTWNTDEPVTAENFQDILDDPNAVIVDSVEAGEAFAERFKNHQPAIYAAIMRDLQEM